MKSRLGKGFRRRRMALAARRRRSWTLRLECLECRQLLAADLLITEFMASNETTLQDSDGAWPDWIEIHNAGTEQVGLAGWMLSDDAGNLDKWEFPSLTIDPGQYLVVFASGKDRKPESVRLEQDFHLTEDGTFVVDLPPGTYEVSLTMGDALKVRDDMAIYVQGELRETLSTEAGAYAVWTTVAEVSEATESRLALRIEDRGGETIQAVINALVIAPTAGGESLRFDFGEAGSPVELDYVAVTPADTYSGEVDYGWLPGAAAIAKDRGGSAEAPHTNFKLSATGEYLALVSPAGVVVSGFGPDGSNYPPQFIDTSYGLPADGSGPGYLASATPGAANSTKRSAAVEFDRPSGVFREPFSLALSVDTPGATIHFTTNGQEPTEESPVYAGPINISATTHVQAIAVAPGLAVSTRTSAWFLTVDADLADFSSNLPIIVFENFSHGLPGEEVYQLNAMAVFEPAAGSGRSSLLNAPTVTTRSGLRKRGSLSVRQAKANYALEIWDEQNDDKDLSLLGMPGDSDWVLYAPYDYDRAMLRNALIFELSNQMGRYAPRTRFVEVYINTTGGDLSSQDYHGVYVLMEKITSGPDRVDIQQLEPYHENEPEISGGWLLKIDPLDPGDRGFYVGGESRAIAYVDPKEAEVTPAQASWIKNHINEMHAAIRDTDPETGYAKYIDVDSWIDNHILNTFPMNTDALRRSVYFFKDRGGKIEMGPLWDFNRSMEAADLPRDDNPEAWQNPGVLTDYFGHNWWGELFQDPNFKQKWIDRWFELRRDILSWSHVESMIDSMAAEVAEAQVRNFERWPEKPPRTADQSTYQGGLDGTWEGEVTQMKAWVENRLTWIDSNFAAPPVITPGTGHVPLGQEITMSGGPGPVYYTTDGSDPRLPGGGIHPNAIVFDAEVPLVFSQPVTIVARALPDGAWSAPITAQLLVAGGPDDATHLAVTEINYHPYAPTDSERALGWSRNDFEFIELANMGDHPIDLAGVAFTDGIEFTFRSGDASLLAPGAHAVVVANPNAFAARYGTGLPVAGVFASGQLSNGGEQIVLADRYGFVIQDFEYHDTDPWPGRADGTGSTLEVIDTAGDYGAADNWRSSGAYGGSPGQAGTPPVSDVVVNEILSWCGALDPGGIELLNRTNSEVDLSGWYLSDDQDDLQKTAIPNGTTIGAGAYLVLSAAQIDFPLRGPTGGNVWLMESDRNGHLVRFVDHVEFEAADVGVSVGRWPNGDPGGILLPLASTSLGAANGGPWTGAVIISEVHYHPPSGPIMAADFSAGTAEDFTPVLGTWNVRAGGYEVTPGPEGDTIATIATRAPLPVNFDFSATMNIRAVPGFNQNGMLVFDYHGPTDFKFVSVHVEGNKWKIGQRDETGWNFLQERSVPRGIQADTDLTVDVEIRGSSVLLRASGISLEHDFETALNDGQAGVASKNGTPRFEQVELRLKQTSEPLNLEFLELVGTTEASTDLTGWRINGAVELTFAPGTTIAGGEVLVVVGFDPADTDSVDSFRNAFGIDGSVAIVGPYAGTLSDGGDVVQLVKPVVFCGQNPGFVPVDSVPYGVELPWPSAANGQGSALSRVATEAFGHLASSWSALAPSPGTTRFAQVGDLDFDGAVDTDDIRRFAQVLADPWAYEAVFGRWAAMLADVDGDEDVDFNDIDDFMALLGGALAGTAR